MHGPSELTNAIRVVVQISTSGWVKGCPEHYASGCSASIAADRRDQRFGHPERQLPAHDQRAKSIIINTRDALSLNGSCRGSAIYAISSPDLCDPFHTRAPVAGVVVIL